MAKPETSPELMRALDVLARVGEPARTPSLRASLPCRYGCKAPAAWLVELPDGGVCFEDRLQAFCEQHATKETELTRPRSRFVARIKPPGPARKYVTLLLEDVEGKLLGEPDEP